MPVLYLCFYWLTPKIDILGCSVDHFCTKCSLRKFDHSGCKHNRMRQSNISVFAPRILTSKDWVVCDVSGVGADLSAPLIKASLRLLSVCSSEDTARSQDIETQNHIWSLLQQQHMYQGKVHFVFDICSWSVRLCSVPWQVTAHWC